MPTIPDRKIYIIGVIYKRSTHRMFATPHHIKYPSTGWGIQYIIYLQAPTRIQYICTSYLVYYLVYRALVFWPEYIHIIGNGAHVRRAYIKWFNYIRQAYSTRFSVMIIYFR